MYAIRFALVGLAFAPLLALVSSCSTADTPTSTGPAAPDLASLEADPVVVAAGDIVCGAGTSATAPCQHAATAALVGSLAPSAVLVLGDNQYERGTLAD